MLEFLATEMGFTIFSIEANMPEAYRLNDYVLNGNGDPAKLIKGMYFWTWDTQEVLDMVLWMREFNKSGKGRFNSPASICRRPTSPRTQRERCVCKILIQLFQRLTAKPQQPVRSAEPLAGERWDRTRRGSARPNQIARRRTAVTTMKSSFTICTGSAGC
jgi:hypothetical protein